MRDVATLVWVVLIFVGVISSIISSIRKQTHGAPSPRPQRAVPRRAPLEPSVAPPPRGPEPPKAAPPAPSLVPEPHRKRRPFFARKGDAVRAIVGAEVLGKPKALSDEPFRY
jgi:hypothetical protein